MLRSPADVQLLSSSITGGPVTSFQYDKAVQVLGSFDAVLITERLREKTVQAYAAAILGLPALRAFPRENANRKDARTKDADEAVSGDSLDLLRELNAADIKLYAYARDLMQHRIASLAHDDDRDVSSSPRCNASLCQNGPFHVENSETLVRRCKKRAVYTRPIPRNETHRTHDPESNTPPPSPHERFKMLLSLAPNTQMARAGEGALVRQRGSQKPQDGAVLQGPG